MASFASFLIFLTRADATAADSQPVGLNGKAGPELVCLVEKWIWTRGRLSFRRQGAPMGDRYRWGSQNAGLGTGMGQEFLDAGGGLHKPLSLGFPSPLPLSLPSSL